MVPLRVYLLVSHGSRDPRPQQALERLARLFVEELQSVAKPSHREIVSPSQPNPWRVGTAVLEFGMMPLHEQIRHWMTAIARFGGTIELLPLFLLPGKHVREDLPEEVARATSFAGTEFRPFLDPAGIRVELRPFLGSHPDMASLLAESARSLPADAWILVSHGTRRAGGNAPVEAIARTLESQWQNPTRVAYYSVEPTLTQQVHTLVARGYERVGILPYFLFAGGITDEIARQADALQRTHPSVRLHLAEPIGASRQLARSLLDLAEGFTEDVTESTTQSLLEDRLRSQRETNDLDVPKTKFQGLV